MPKLPPHLRATLDALHAHATTNGECQMALSELAHYRGVTNRTVHNHIHQLKIDGYLTIHYRPGKPSIYHLIDPAPGSGWRLGQRCRGITGFLQRLGTQPSSTGDNRTATDQPAASPALNRSQGTSLIGRADILATLQENAAKRRHTLLAGPLGIGKSHILRHFATQLEKGSRGDKETRGQEPALSLSKGDSATEGRPHPVTPSPCLSRPRLPHQAGPPDPGPATPRRWEPGSRGHRSRLRRGA